MVCIYAGAYEVAQIMLLELSLSRHGKCLQPLYIVVQHHGWGAVDGV